ncbi:MAG: LysR family transcriptional regulator [Rhodocyclaceae bacterium]|nr:LysR family transcriptional regulator [Rhodocyclaceae bacterium]
MHVTQPTLSRQLAELEDELGVRLFVHQSHGVALTADGLRMNKHSPFFQESEHETTHIRQNHRCRRRRAHGLARRRANRETGEANDKNRSGQTEQRLRHARTGARHMDAHRRDLRKRGVRGSETGLSPD